MNRSFYNGKELELFSKASNWKEYFSGFIRPYLKGSILETGAGIGTTTIYLNRSATILSWMLLEPDPNFCSLLDAAVADKKLPGTCIVQQGDIFSLEEKECFDAIIYIDVLEHIKEDHKEIDQAIKLLKKNGYLIILSPAHQTLYSAFDKAIGHHRRYDTKSLTQVVGAKNMVKVSVRYLDSLGSFLSWGNRMLTRQSYPTSAQIKLWDKFLVPVTRIIDKLVFYTFGRSILGVWRKK
jgi:2-polyprenyl-3-methyl-5-hydroxy-6-metoxy-1,4-benzoquinol methylase